jgi:hypothetical protein
MPDTSGAIRPVRTVLEQLIRERRQTLEEFVAYAETFARQHNEPGTLGVRHLQRLMAGRRSDGRPLGPVKPVTARLLERIFGAGIEELLSPPSNPQNEDDSGRELRERLRNSERVDAAVIGLLYEQLNAVRRLDRQLGATIAHDEVRMKIEQVKRLVSYSLSPDARTSLAALLAELSMLAGWQALDLRKAMDSWQHYELAKAAANESDSEAFEIHTAAQQAFVLIDLDRPSEAVNLVASARARAAKSSPPLLRSWLAAAHGEALAASLDYSGSLQAFDDAAKILPTDIISTEGPYVALDPVHLDRWRGHAIARLGTADAVAVLSNALDRLDPSFTRAETALRVDLAIALNHAGEGDEARRQANQATRLAEIINSARQRRRVQTLTIAV